MAQHSTTALASTKTFPSGCPPIPRPADLRKVVEGWPEPLRARWEATAGALEELGVSARDANLDAYRAVCGESGRDEADGDLPFDVEWFDRAQALADYPPIPAAEARVVARATDAAMGLFGDAPQATKRSQRR